MRIIWFDIKKFWSWERNYQEYCFDIKKFVDRFLINLFQKSNKDILDDQVKHSVYYKEFSFVNRINWHARYKIYKNI